MKFKLNNPKDWEVFAAYLASCDESKSYTVEIVQKRNRTDQQRKAIEVYCSMLADMLNDKGCYMAASLKRLKNDPYFDVPWTQDEVKDRLYRPTMAHMFKVESTTQLEPDQPSKVADVLNNKLIEMFDVSAPWPDRHG
ncbi:MAG: hypothetical protein HRU12_08790 [Phaeodactylibacter sp.]|nr:hypothetical protein [Phaeodactylibacter sp.]